MENCIKTINLSYYTQTIGGPDPTPTNCLILEFFRKRLRNGLATFPISRYVDPERTAHPWRFE